MDEYSGMRASDRVSRHGYRAAGMCVAILCASLAAVEKRARLRDVLKLKYNTAGWCPLLRQPIEVQHPRAAFSSPLLFLRDPRGREFDRARH
jgi:hypothetical protein